MSEKSLTYRGAGVDISEQTKAIELFKSAVKSSYNQHVLSDVGSFGGLFDAAFAGYSHPVLVSSIDGVGTKTKIAHALGRYDGLGADIVNHCVNDILVQGAKPLFFLDYFAASKLSAQVAAQVVESAAKACKQNGCALIGGEIAEMPGVYAEGEIDIVGCIVGVVDKPNILPRNVQNGDILVGLPSEGLHTNGYSLARKALFEIGGFDPHDSIGSLGETIGDALLRPHRSYLADLQPHLASGTLHALAHITGGGIEANLSRVIPDGLRAQIDFESWTPPPIFDLIRSAGSIPESEMRAAFNLGIGMIAVVSSPDALLGSIPGSIKIGVAAAE
jgi:phosphoribosylformylglycinamidine cyclo-ligase